MTAPADSVDALVACGDYLAAARRAQADGDLPRAIHLLTRIWRFAEAVPLAEAIGDPVLAVRLSLDARDLARARHIAASIPEDRVGALEETAAAFAAASYHGDAAANLGRAGRWAAAADAYRKAGAWLEAGTMFERAGCWQDAGRLYERAIDSVESDSADAALARLALGRLLGNLGRPLEATRGLQAAARHASTRARAQRRLCGELLALGFSHAADEIARRLHAADPRVPHDPVAIAVEELGRAPSEAAAPPAVPRRFRVLRALGSGSLGRAYAAEDELIGRTVVLKVLATGPGASGPERDAFLRFLREAEAIRRLRHPNIVTLYDLDQTAGLLVLEYLPGGTLAEALEARGPLPQPSARRVALDVLAALATAHRRGIVHRDVKPANILFDGAGNAKLADFGAAHLLDYGHTQTGSFVGTLAYLSPEQITGSSIGFPADLYGLGVTLYQALTGRPAFLGPDIVGQHLAEAPVPPSTLRPDLTAAHDQVLLRALAKTPEERFPSAESMAEAIRDWPAVEPATPSRPAPAAAPPAIAPAASLAATTPAAPPRRPLGRTARGQLVLAFDPRVERAVLIEELDAPLPAAALATVRGLAAAGGPRVQRVLALGTDQRSIVYERIEGDERPLSSLPAATAALLDESWERLAPHGWPRAPGHPVVATAAGPVILVAPPIESPASGDRSD